jgi:hypothetical protein
MHHRWPAQAPEVTFKQEGLRKRDTNKVGEGHSLVALDGDGRLEHILAGQQRLG